MSLFSDLGKSWKAATTEHDGETKCPVRLGAIGTAIIYHAGAAWMVFGQHTSLDVAIMGQYVQHMCYLIGTSGLAIGAKSVMKGDAQ